MHRMSCEPGEYLTGKLKFLLSNKIIMGSVFNKTSKLIPKSNSLLGGWDLS